MKTITITYNPETCAGGDPYDLFYQINALLNDVGLHAATAQRDATPEEVEEVEAAK